MMHCEKSKKSRIYIVNGQALETVVEQRDLGYSYMVP